MKEIITEGKSVQEAVEKGLQELSLRRDQVEVVVLSEGTKGIFGIGSKKAKVLVREKKWTGEHPFSKNSHAEPGSQNVPTNPQTTHDAITSPPTYPSASREMGIMPEAGSKVPDILEQSKIVLSQILNLMGISFKITDIRYEQDNSKILIKFDSPDSYLFTYGQGRCLQSLQFIVNLICNKNKKKFQEIQIDTGNYWDRKEKEIIKKIEFAVKTVKRTGKDYRLQPMPSNLRKFVHRLIKNSYPDMETISEGEGRWRKVVIRPTANKMPK